MSEFIESEKYYVPCEFDASGGYGHRFIMVGEHFRQQIVAIPKPHESPFTFSSLEVTCWQHAAIKAISQAQMQLHIQWIRDSINLLKELCAQ